ncbi:hypothetical protein RB195_013157 [Necator americanus]|uniref:Reverse transcriptase domain-containing protein n=1 Tax=Necator americanus TaxID=51031 RepID=A0ABR1DU78_NECAM
MRTQKRKPATARDRNPHLESGIGDQTRPYVFYADQMCVQRTVLSTLGAGRSLEESRGLFIEHLRKARLDEDCVVESFDVTSLYANISTDAALQATLELVFEHQGSEEGDDAETLDRIKINSNLSST